MRLASVEAVIRALNEAEVRFLVAGGLAVNAHGYLRFTKDADLVVQLEPGNVRRAFEALARISAEDFADAELRQRWIREKGMRVLQFWSDRHRETPLDVFVEEPFSFDEEYAAALVKDLAGAGPVRFVSRRTLIAMKEAAGRAVDRIDVEHLRLGLQSDEERS